MTESEPPLSLGASIVLYRTHIRQVDALISSMLTQGASRIYIVDNSPLTFDTFSGWVVPPEVTVIRTGMNLGYGGGHNLAIRDSVLRHRYHLISNPDIYLSPDTLPKLLDVMESHSDIGLVMPRVVGVNGEQHYLCKRAPSPLDFLPSPLVPRKWRSHRRAQFEMRDHDYDHEFEVECLSGCFMFFRCSVLEAIKGFDEDFFLYMEDFDLSRRARRVSRNLYCPATSVVHEHQRGHRTSWKLRCAFARSLVTYFNKWGWCESPKSREGICRVPSQG